MCSFGHDFSRSFSCSQQNRVSRTTGRVSGQAVYRPVGSTMNEIHCRPLPRPDPAASTSSACSPLDS
jgi:hypothetical protein